MTTYRRATTASVETKNASLKNLHTIWCLVSDRLTNRLIVRHGRRDDVNKEIYLFCIASASVASFKTQMNWVSWISSSSSSIKLVKQNSLVVSKSFQSKCSNNQRQQTKVMWEYYISFLSYLVLRSFLDDGHDSSQEDEETNNDHFDDQQWHSSRVVTSAQHSNRHTRT